MHDIFVRANAWKNDHRFLKKNPVLNPKEFESHWLVQYLSMFPRFNSAPKIEVPSTLIYLSIFSQIFPPFHWQRSCRIAKPYTVEAQITDPRCQVRKLLGVQERWWSMGNKGRWGWLSPGVANGFPVTLFVRGLRDDQKKWVGIWVTRVWLDIHHLF